MTATTTTAAHTTTRPSATDTAAMTAAVMRLRHAFSEGVGRLDLSDLGLNDLPSELASFALFTTYGTEGISSDVSVFASKNDLDEFPTVLLALRNNLAVLSLRANRLHELPRAVAELTHLKELSISSNELNYLPYEIERLPKLKRLQAALNPFVPPGRTDAAPVVTLKELALRAIHEHRDHAAVDAAAKRHLPSELQAILATEPLYCCECNRCVYSERHERFVSKSVHSSQDVTVRYILCSMPCVRKFEEINSS